MATTRAEALARYARANRVQDITHVPRFVPDSDDNFDASSWGELGQAATATFHLMRRRATTILRMAVLGCAIVLMTPALPALLS